MTFKVLDRGGGKTEIVLHDAIGWDGVSAQEFCEALNDVDATDIDVRITSPGGNVFDGLAMMNALKNHGANITTYVEGVALSAASFIAVGGSHELVMCPGSELMIHDAMGNAAGNAEQMEKVIKSLDRESDNIARMYAAKAGGSAEEWREAMRAETWFSAEEAVEAGLADRIGNIERDSELVTTNFSEFEFVNMYKGRQGKPPARLLNHEGGFVSMDAETISKIVAEAVSKALKIEPVEPVENEASEQVVEPDKDEQVDETVEPVESEPVKDEPETDEPEADDEDKAEDNAVGNVVTVDAETFAELQAQAAKGRELYEAEQVRALESEVDTWINEGRISAGLKAKALEAIKRDADAARNSFGSNPVNTVPRNSVGHSVEEVEAEVSTLTDFANKARLFAGPSF